MARSACPDRCSHFPDIGTGRTRARHRCNHPRPHMHPRSRNAVSTILLGGLVAGTLDIVYAIGFWAIKAGVAPIRILQSIAAGVLGEASFNGGIGSAALGLVLHYLIMFAMVGVYFLLARRWPPLR